MSSSVILCFISCALSGGEESWQYWPSKTANMKQVLTVLSSLGGGINDVSFAYHTVSKQKEAQSIPGMNKFSKKLGATSKFQASEDLQKANSTLWTHKHWEPPY